MKLLIVLFTVLVLASCGNKNESIEGKNAREFKVSAAVVDELHLFDVNGNESHLKKEGNIWRLNDNYVARQDAVDKLLETMEFVRFRNPVPKTAHENIVKNIISNHTKVEVFSKGKAIMSYFVGGQTQDGKGTYFLKQDPKTGDNAKEVVIVEIPGFNGYLSPRYFAQESLWRDRKVFAYEKGQLAQLEVNYPSSPNDGFKIVVNNGNVSLYNHQDQEMEGNDVAIKQYLLNYKEVNFEAIATNDMQQQIDSLNNAEPYYTITITDNQGRINQLAAHRRKPIKEELDINGDPLLYDTDRLFAIINNKDELIIIQYYVFDPLTVKLDYFLQGV